MASLVILSLLLSAAAFTVFGLSFNKMMRHNDTSDLVTSGFVFGLLVGIVSLFSPFVIWFIEVTRERSARSDSAGAPLMAHTANIDNVPFDRSEEE